MYKKNFKKFLRREEIRKIPKKKSKKTTLKIQKKLCFQKILEINLKGFKIKK